MIVRNRFFALVTNQLLNEIIQWDVRSWSKALHYWEQNVDWSEVGTALELGGRQGGLSLWLALKGKNVICSDLCNAKQTAEPLHSKYNVASLISYEDIDATAIPYTNHFDVIAFKSVIGGIGRGDNIAKQQRVFDEIHKALKPGGKLLFAENLVGSSWHQQLRKRFVLWGNAWRYVTVEDLKRFMQNFHSSEVKTTGIAAAFGRTEGQRSLLSRIDDLFLRQICPQNWNYIAYGIAEKRGGPPC